MEPKSFLSVMILFTVILVQISETKLDRKRLTSPGFPNPYPFAYMADEVQHFSTISNHRIRVLVKTANLNPKGDTLTISDGLMSCGYPLKQYVGLTDERHLPLMFFSISNKICLHFDRWNGGERKYKGYEIDIFEFPRCTGDLTDEYGDIVSPNYNYLNYRANEDCEWRITADPGQGVVFNVEEFSVGCAAGDDVIIDDGNTTTSLCQKEDLSATDKFFARNNVAILKFKSRSRSKGFWVKYKMVGCGELELPTRYGTPVNPSSYYPYGYRLQYRCPTGHWYNENMDTLYLTCLETGKWRPNHNMDMGDTTCKPLSCGDPGIPSNCKRHLRGPPFLYGTTVLFQCDHNFALVGKAARTCLANGTWSDEQPICSGKTNECSLLPDPEFGARIGNNTGFGQSVSFRCDAGYRLVGDSEIRCETGGQWSHHVPRCQAVECPTLLPPDHGTIDGPVKAVSKFGDSVEFVCDDGYRMVTSGNGIADCLKNGTWDEPPPTCEAITCPPPTLPVNGRATWRSLRYLAEARYSCFPGFTLDGAHVSRCGEDGWTSTVPICNPVACPALSNDSLVNAYVTSPDVSQSSRVYHFGQNVEVVCDVGYSMQPHEVMTSLAAECNETGKWSSDVSKGCPYVIECPALSNDSLVNAYVTSPDVSQSSRVFHFGQNAEVVCDVGYSMQPHEVVTSLAAKCNETGEWSSDLSSGCPYDVECPPLTSLPLSASLLTGPAGNDTAFSSEATIVCTASGRLEIITCTGTGQWSIPLTQLCLHDTADTGRGDNDKEKHNPNLAANAEAAKGRDQFFDWWWIIVIVVGSIVTLAIISFIILRIKRRRKPEKKSVDPEEHEYDNPVYGVSPDDDQVIMSRTGDVAFKRGDDWLSNPTYHNAARTLERPDSLFTDEGIYGNVDDYGATDGKRLTTFSGTHDQEGGETNEGFVDDEEPIYDTPGPAVGVGDGGLHSDD